MTHESSGFDVEFINIPVLQIYLWELVGLEVELNYSANREYLNVTVNSQGE